MKEANVLYRTIVAGTLRETDNGTYQFVYKTEYLMDSRMPPVSLTLPKRNEVFESETLFPFFFNMLSEGANKKMQCRILKIDENDYFSLLIKTGNNETIGAITVEEKV